MNSVLMKLSSTVENPEEIKEMLEKGEEAAEEAVHSPISEILLTAVVGFATVFVVLVALMIIISLISKIFSDKKKTKPEPVVTEAAPATEQDERVDSYTGVKLIGVSDRDAALIMAIVADGLDMPLDNLRFISIKEVK